MFHAIGLLLLLITCLSLKPANPEEVIPLADGSSAPFLAVQGYDSLQIWIDNSIGNHPVIIVAVLDAEYREEFSSLNWVDYDAQTRTLKSGLSDSPQEAELRLSMLEIFADKQDFYEAEMGEYWPLKGFDRLTKPDDALRSPARITGTANSLVTLKRELFSEASWEMLKANTACLIVQVSDDFANILPVCHAIELNVNCKPLAE